MSNERSEMTNELTNGVQCINSIIYLLSRGRVNEMRLTGVFRVVSVCKGRGCRIKPQPLAVAGK